MTWDGATAEWWLREVRSDPAYARDVDALLDSLADRPLLSPVLDVGCGDGRLLHRFGAVGVDRSLDLLRHAGRGVGADITRLPFGEASFGSAYLVLVMEHVADPSVVFDELARVVRPGGSLLVVVNHPIVTAPGSGPFVDPDDGEVTWRWGEYLATGSSLEPGGLEGIEFHHRPIGALLESAADAGWSLDRLLERPLTPDDDPLLAVQLNIPRLLGASWTRAGPGAKV